MDATWARLLYRELEKTAGHTSWSDRDKTLALGTLLEKLFGELTKREQIAFSTLFTRISYVGHIHQLSPVVLRNLQYFRRTVQRTRQGHPADASDVAAGVQALVGLVQSLSGSPAPGSLNVPAPVSPAGTLPGDTRVDAMRVVAVEDRPEQNCLIVFAEQSSDEPLRMLYGLPDRNENFNPSILAIRKVFGFPVTLRLLAVEIDGAGNLKPRGLVIEPDYLVDISAIAECFKEYGAEPLYHLVKKFLPYEVTPAILLGNIANHFLDRLLHEPEAEFSELFRETFALYPLVYAPMPDAEVRSLAIKARKHYHSLRQMAGGGFALQGIEASSAVLEPSFFSARYGLQGRLDLFFRENDRAAIVELKSGQPFRPNSYGIARGHFTQTLLYDLLTRSVYGHALSPAKYILYSGADEQLLRFAPTVEAEQWEAIQVRNQLVAIERLLTAIRPGDAHAPVFDRLRSSPFEGKGFLMRDMARFENAYRNLNPLERKYVLAFTGFIAREHWLAKCGVEGSEQTLGHAALWRMPLAEKEQAFSILAGLRLADNRANEPDPTLLFEKTSDTNPLANFRVGDIAVLYPVERPGDTVLAHQVIKCTITALTPEHVQVALRYRQSNDRPFRHSGPWAIEPDLLDSGYVNLYRNLFEWMEAPGATRARVLDPVHWVAAAAPETHPPAPDFLTAEQALLWRKMIAQTGYFLLWGPPGTGKTSVMLRAYVQWVLDHTTDNILLMAYTNRAVDEMCEALERMGPHMRDQYWRIGSRFSTAEAYRDRLLSRRVSAVNTRNELLDTLRSRRVVLSTVASFSQNSALLSLHPFQRLLIDEASQLLEPQLTGLLTRFRTAVLIGDHRQLPAVVAQHPEHTLVADPDLRTIGLLDLRDAYFERLYRRCLALGLDAHIGQLDRQGRMHAEIMAFPNRNFYGGTLKTMGDDPGHVQHAPAPSGPWPAGLPPLPPGFHLTAPERLAARRTVFIPSPVGDALPGAKNNRSEAEMIAWLVRYFQAWYRVTGRTWIPEHSLGIITPWRAQIAQIRQTLEQEGLDPNAFTIDTVERYQGGARDVILISCCVNAPHQLEALVSLSAEGIDRKLNVALTRAREHVVVLGNAQVLGEDPRYRSLMDAWSVK